MTLAYPYWPDDAVFLGDGTYPGSPDPFFRQNTIMYLSNSRVNQTGFGTLTTGSDVAPTTVNDYMLFNGTTSIVRYTDSTDAWKVTAPYSIEFEFMPLSNNTAQFILSIGEGFGLGFPELSVIISSANIIELRTASANTSADTVSLNIISDYQLNRWYRVGIMFYGSRLRVYVNDRQVVDVAVNVPWNSTSGFALGCDTANVLGNVPGQRHFNGRIRNVRMGRALWWPVSNTLPADPIYIPPVPQWITGTGYLTSYSENDVVSLPLIITDPSDDIDSYIITAGSLPPGISLNSLSGYLVGTVGSVLQDERYNFTVTVTYGGSYTVSGNFEILVLNSTTSITWNTPAGLVGDVGPGEPIMTVISATSV